MLHQHSISPSAHLNAKNLLQAPFLLPVGTRPEAHKQHANTYCKNVYEKMRKSMTQEIVVV